MLNHINGHNKVKSFWKIDDSIMKSNNKKIEEIDDIVPDVILQKYCRQKHFDFPDGLVDYLLFEDYVDFERPAYTKLPFAYNKVPVSVRNFVFKALKAKKKPGSFPAWPSDNTVDRIRSAYIKSLGKKNIPFISFWPNGKKFALSVTHDIETERGFDGIKPLRDIEAKYGVRSTWNIVPFYYKPDFGLLLELQREGCEIGIHGYDHSGRLAFSGEEAIIKKLNAAKEYFRKNGILVKSYRSPQLLMTKSLMSALSRTFAADSSIPDTDINAPASINRGSCTFFPFFIGNTVEIPLTLPQDFRLIETMKMSPDEIFGLWKKKIDIIIENNGVVVLLTHPDPHVFGDKRYHDVYDKILTYLTSKDPWIATTGEIAEWWKARNKMIIDKGIIRSINDSKNIEVNMEKLTPFVDYF